ncbi:MAG: hypothetical protein HQL11_06925 [Candidatus Omnitrophica bacterium]|nr:hypothetical protein [Candidatus Omnitrophota bacterium]
MKGPIGSGIQYVINCAGQKVPVSDSGFTSRCAIGNTDDYLKSFGKHASARMVELGEPAFITVVVPSCASEEDDLRQTLVSLCSQKYPVAAEILVFVNEPEKAPERVRRMNDHTESLVRSVQSAGLKGGENTQLRLVRQTVPGGSTGVYQAVTASSIARVRTHCDRLMAGAERQQKIQCIEKYLRQCLLLLWDDDIQTKDTSAIAGAYEAAVNGDAVILGRLRISRVDTAAAYAGALHDLMQLFLEFKYDLGLNFLSPRGMLLAGILREGGVRVGEPFADQLYFASAARGKKQHLLDAETAIGESDSPGNGNFLKKLRLYLEGGENDALEIFQNVLNRYREDRPAGRYCEADIQRILLDLRTRDFDRIGRTAAELLAKA